MTVIQNFKMCIFKSFQKNTFVPYLAYLVNFILGKQIYSEISGRNSVAEYISKSLH